MQGTLAIGCYDNAEFDTSDVDNANKFCSLLKRINNKGNPLHGQVSRDLQNPGAISTYGNAAYILFEGLTAMANYSVPLTGLGMNEWNLNLGAQYFYLHRRRESVTSTTEIVDEGVGGSAQHQASANASLSDGTFSVSLSAFYSAPTLRAANWTYDNAQIFRNPALWMTNGAFGWNFKKGSLNFAVANLLNKTVPFPYSGLGSGGDYLGRRFTVSVGYKL